MAKEKKYKNREGYKADKVKVSGYTATRYKKKATPKKTTASKTSSKFPLRKGQIILNYNGKKYKYLGPYPKEVKGQKLYMFKEDGSSVTNLESLSDLKELIKKQSSIKKSLIENEINSRRTKSRERNKIKKQSLYLSKFKGMSKSPMQVSKIAKVMNETKSINGKFMKRYEYIEGLVRKFKRAKMKNYKLRPDKYIQFKNHSTIYPVSTATEFKYFDYLMKK